MLAHLRNGDTYARLSAGFKIGVATVYRYIGEAVDLLAAQAPSLTAAAWQLVHNGRRAARHPYELINNITGSHPTTQ